MLSRVPTPTNFRIVRRCPAHRKVIVAVRAVRPSLLDLRLQGDPWIIYANDRAGVYFGRCQLTSLPAVPLDVPALNNQLQTFRHRTPRRAR
jgi:hypothetical protein